MAHPLPTYQPQLTPLTSKHVSTLSFLAQSPTLGHVHTHIKAAIDRLTASASIINERLVEAQGRDAKSRKRRREEGGHDGEEGEDAAGGEERENKPLRMLGEKTAELNEKLEERMRMVIDEQVKVSRLVDVLGELGAGKELILPGYSSTIEAEGREMGACEKWKWRVEREEEIWKGKSMLERYGNNNDYKQLKRAVHEAVHANREEIPPLPPVSTWFDDVPGASGAANTSSSRQKRITRRSAAAAAEESDDEIQISREKQSLKCPITLLPFKQPVTSTKCPHSYEKDAILSMIRSSDETTRDGFLCVRCPVCQCMLTENDVVDDMVLKRKVKRWVEGGERGEGRMFDDDDEEEEEEEEEEEQSEQDEGEREVSVVPDTQI